MFYVLCPLSCPKATRCNPNLKTTHGLVACSGSFDLKNHAGHEPSTLTDNISRQFGLRSGQDKLFNMEVN